jgi:hypothetical protein
MAGETLPYDFSCTTAPERSGWQCGCPEGYGVQFVGEDRWFPDAVAAHVGPDGRLRLFTSGWGTAPFQVQCRTVASATPQQLQSDAEDLSGRVTQQIAAVMRQTVEGIGAGLRIGGEWLLLAGLAYLMLMRTTRTNPPRRWNPRPRRLTYRNNPPVEGVIPGRVEEIRYQRTGRHAGPYKHRFTSPASLVALRDGSVLVKPQGRRKLWGYY